MKRIFSLFLLLVAFNVSAIDINPKLSGIWYNPNQSGHGLNVAVLDENLTIIYWYTYHTDGTPMFLITVGQNQGNRIVGNTYYNTGMKFGDFDPNDIQESVWGTTTVTFNDCISASLQYSSNVLGYGSGTIPMQRLASVAGMKCTNSPLTGNYHLTLGYRGGLAIGVAHLFENGYVGFWAAGETGAVSGFGAYSWINDERFNMGVTIFDTAGGWEDFSGSGEYNGGVFSANFPNNVTVLGTKVENFNQTLNADVLTGTFDIKQGTVVVGVLTVDRNGNASGRIFNGCDLNGFVWAPDYQFNQIVLDLNTSSCDWGPKVYGTGNVGKDGVLALEATDNFRGLIWILER